MDKLAAWPEPGMAAARDWEVTHTPLAILPDDLAYDSASTSIPFGDN